VQWDPDLAIIGTDGSALPIEMRDFRAFTQSDGTVDGVAAVAESGVIQDYLDGLKKGKGSARPESGILLVASGRVSDMKKLRLDESGSLARINSLEIRSCSANGWPSIRVDYESYFADGADTAVIAWSALFDVGTESLAARAPLAIAFIAKDGTESGDVLSVHRASPTEVDITGAVSKTLIQYPCGDRCVVEAPALLKQWPR
jgi:hypothetical protein